MRTGTAAVRLLMVSLSRRRCVCVCVCVCAWKTVQGGSETRPLCLTACNFGSIDQIDTKFGTNERCTKNVPVETLVNNA